MNIAIAVLLLIGLCLVLAWGFISMIQSLASSDMHDGPGFREPGPIFHDHSPVFMPPPSER